MSLEDFIDFLGRQRNSRSEDPTVELFRENVDYYIELYRYAEGLPVSRDVTQLYTEIDIGKPRQRITDLDLVAINGNDVYIFIPFGVKVRLDMRVTLRGFWFILWEKFSQTLCGDF